MSKENMFDAAIESLIKDSFNENKSAWMDAYIQGKPVLVKPDGSVEVIEDYYKQPEPVI